MTLQQWLHTANTALALVSNLVNLPQTADLVLLVLVRFPRGPVSALAETVVEEPPSFVL